MYIIRTSNQETSLTHVGDVSSSPQRLKVPPGNCESASKDHARARTVIDNPLRGILETSGGLFTDSDIFLGAHKPTPSDSTPLQPSTHSMHAPTTYSALPICCISASCHWLLITASLPSTVLGSDYGSFRGVDPNLFSENSGELNTP